MRIKKFFKNSYKKRIIKNSVIQKILIHVQVRHFVCIQNLAGCWDSNM